MSLVWSGQKVADTVGKSDWVVKQGEGMAVWVGEESNVKAVVSRRAAKRLSARLLNEDPDAREGGFFFVRRNDAGEWVRE